MFPTGNPIGVKRLKKLTGLILVLGGVFFLSPTNTRAAHLMGGQITWECLGSGQYEFFVQIYRDCNGSAGPTTGQLKVWDHPTTNSFPLNLQSSQDISPACNQVAGGPAPVTCGSGGNGAVEKIILSTGAVALPGTPPAQGWDFTWNGFSRSNAIDNLQNAGSYGMTLRATMYPFQGQNTAPCYDNSPNFSEDPLNIVCSGHDTRYNANAFDVDGDSLSYSWAHPLQEAGGAFNPPGDPAYVPSSGGYAFDSPFPGTGQNPSNVPASLDPSIGELHFNAFTQGEFVSVVKVTSWRNGQKIAEVYREMQTFVVNCPAANDQPVVPPPFNAGTSYHDTVYAGQNVIFNFNASDNQPLQDGSQQTVTLSPSGMMFGTNFNNAGGGCPTPPCATLSDPMPLSATNGISTTFSWQTDCDHLLDAGGETRPSRTFKFIFHVKDDYCPVPGVNMSTVSITVLDQADVKAPSLRCASVNGNDVDLSWEAPVDTNNKFDSYHIYRATSLGGPYTVVDSIFNINQTTYTDVGGHSGGGPVHYFIRTRSGCTGSTFSEPSDTLNTIDLQVTDQGNGYAKLTWNQQTQPPNLPSSSGWYRIYREYPVGNWTLMDSVRYGTETYRYPISICSDSVSYRIDVADASGCVSSSTIDGDRFRDRLPPTSPELDNISVDTSSGKARLTWDRSPEGDVEGYIIIQSIDGTDYVIDTVWGANNTTYLNPDSKAENNVETYGVAAFDSCWTGNPPSPNTSARGEVHNTMDVNSKLDVCARTDTVYWNSYINWPSDVDRYEVYAIQGGNTSRIGTTQDTFFVHQNVTIQTNYCYVVRAVSNNGKRALSNKHCHFIDYPTPPDFLYLATATVNDGAVDLHVRTDPASSLDAISYKVLRSTDGISYDTVATIPPVNAPTFSYTDEKADPGSTSYYYEITAVDSCGDPSATSNTGRTIYLTTYANSDKTVNTLQWNLYEDWDGKVVQYNIYRSINGNFQASPIATLAPGKRVYEDQVGDLIEEEGEFCYYIEAVENGNGFGTNEISLSNVSCAYQEPKFWVPNAFMVGGHNNIFKPVAGYVELDNYYFAIHDRWGKKLFETNDLNEGWDGTYQGEVVREGVYVYHFKYYSARGQLVQERGSVTLLKR